LVSVTWSIDMNDIILFTGETADISIDSNEDVFQMSPNDTIFIDLKEKQGNDVFKWLKERNLDAFHGYFEKNGVSNVNLLHNLTEKDLKDWPFGEPSKKFFLSEISTKK
jgi:hypothetical protein